MDESMEKGWDISQAMIEANRCLLCYDAPCSKGCPAGTEPAIFIRKLRMKNITGAIRAIKERNILGGVCGAICPTSMLCEKECVAANFDRPIRIGKIQRALIEHSWKIGFSPLSKYYNEEVKDDFDKIEKVKKEGRKVAIIGGGPAGIACAFELAKFGIKVTIFEEHEKIGGALRYLIPSHRLSNKFLEKETSELAFMGVEIKCNTMIKKDDIKTIFEKGYDAIFLSPGLWKSVRLDDRDIKGVYTAHDFLYSLKEKPEKMKKIVNGKKVAVIGGGSVALDCAESCILYGAKDVYLIYRRSFSQMLSEENERICALRKGVHFIMLNQPICYLLDENGRVDKIKLCRTELGNEDKSGRRAPVEVKGSDWELEVDFVIEAIGSQADEKIKDLNSEIKFDKGLVVVNDKQETSAKLIFAGGDITRGPGLVAQAIGDGKAAAKAIIEKLSKEKTKGKEKSVLVSISRRC
ncbi:MAG: FAD-dependent oxidoreductase [Thermoplasmata archaeon]